MRSSFLTFIPFGAALAITLQGSLASPATVEADVSVDPAIISAIRTELGTPRLDAVSRTLDVTVQGYQILEPALGRVLCGSVEITQSGGAPLTLGAGEPLIVSPGATLRALQATSRVVLVSVIPRFDSLVP